MIVTRKNYKILEKCNGMDEQEIIDSIMKNRGIEDIEHFLNPVEEDMLPLESMYMINNAAKIIENGLENGKKFGIHFDTDTDGVSSGTIMTRYLRNYTDNINTYINTGKMHGLFSQDLSQFNDVDILIIVDSLDKDISQYSKLKESGKQIIVLDHHAINKDIQYDKYITLVSSQREYENPNLSGAGVTWKFCKYLDEYFMEKYADDYADLAACGILADVCDVSESSRENRYIVRKGLKNLKNPAIKKIVGSYEFNSKAILFSVAPLINACCRIGKNDVAMRLFLSDENKEVLKLKKELEACKTLQNDELDRVLPGVYKDFEEQKNFEVLYSVIDSDYGISGLVGNKCLELYNKPMFILKDHDSKLTGSMRSKGYGDFRDLCNKTGLAELNGHEQASGIEIEKENFKEFLLIVNNELSMLKQSTSEDIEIDCEIDVSDITRTLVDKVKTINFISGTGFKPITFKVTGIDDYTISNFKDGKHLVIYPNDYIQLIEWNTCADFEELEDCSLMNEPIEVYGELDSGFFIRKYMLKVIMSDMKVGVA